MQALVFDKSKSEWETTRGLENVDVPDPVLDERANPTDANSLILKVRYAGVCGTDRGIWNRQAFRDAILDTIDGQVGAGGNPYRIVGHELFGEVAQVGSGVRNIRPGDFVSCESHVSCNECYQCLRGEKHVCANEQILGISHDGVFAEFAKVPAHIIWKTDAARIGPEVAALQEPFGNAMHAASKVDLRGKKVAIFGLGTIGMFLTVIAKGLGAACVIGVEPNPVAAGMAKRLGIDYVIPLPASGSGGEPHTHNPDITDAVKRITHGVGVDVSFEMAGFNSSLNNCLHATRRGGHVVLFGINSSDFVLEDYNRFVVHGFTMHAVIGRRVWETWEATRALLQDPSNGVREKLFDIVLAGGNGTILPMEEFSKDRFEEMMAKHPKFLLRF
ncbi:MAG: alcohol dehydrogenase catalytic domain-containing protein [Chthoniobacterales bacterium]